MILTLKISSLLSKKLENPLTGHIARFFLLSWANFCNSLSPTRSLYVYVKPSMASILILAGIFFGPIGNDSSPTRRNIQSRLIFIWPSTFTTREPLVVPWENSTTWFPDPKGTFHLHCAILTKKLWNFVARIFWMWKYLAVVFNELGSIYLVNFWVFLSCRRLRISKFDVSENLGRIDGLML